MFEVNKKKANLVNVPLLNDSVSPYTRISAMGFDMPEEFLERCMAEVSRINSILGPLEKAPNNNQLAVAFAAAFAFSEK